MRIGTPGYMSPEQIEGGDIDRRSDIFAVGAVFYELLAYREAFTGRKHAADREQGAGVAAAASRSLVPDLDPGDRGDRHPALAKESRRSATRMRRRSRRRSSSSAGGSGRRQYAAAAATAHADAEPAPRARLAGFARRRRLPALASPSTQDGADEAARRFAIEALAEDPESPGGACPARSRSAPSTLPPPPRRRRARDASRPTARRTGSHPMGTRPRTRNGARAPARPPSGASSPGGPVTGAPSARRYADGRHRRRGGCGRWRSPLVSWLWMWWRSGPHVDDHQPTGGTISGRGITCGTARSDCRRHPRGETVELRAEPDAGFVFAGLRATARRAAGRHMTAARDLRGDVRPVARRGRHGRHGLAHDSTAEGRHDRRRRHHAAGRSAPNARRTIRTGTQVTLEVLADPSSCSAASPATCAARARPS